MSQSILPSDDQCLLFPVSEGRHQRVVLPLIGLRLQEDEQGGDTKIECIGGPADLVHGDDLVGDQYAELDDVVQFPLYLELERGCTGVRWQQ